MMMNINPVSRIERSNGPERLKKRCSVTQKNHRLLFSNIVLCGYEAAQMNMPPIAHRSRVMKTRAWRLSESPGVPQGDSGDS